VAIDGAQLAEEARQAQAMARSFRTKPVVIEAMQYHGSNASVVENFIGRRIAQRVDNTDSIKSPALLIDTLEGTMAVLPMDWIIKGVKGEFYPCKPDIFEATYEPAFVAADASAYERAAVAN
jgi:hypothetical protein